jgi:hypothetical protein
MESIPVTRRQFSVQLGAALVMPLLTRIVYPKDATVEKKAMQITLERSGGFTGIPLTITVDTATLSPDQVTQLRHFVETADFFHMPAAPSIPAQPDRFEYEVTVQEGDRTHTVTFGEVAVPEPLRPLLNWLMETAQPS